ncbi:hypothetical protein JXJ21_12170 [candidate division KSB1 bacterium]|nr:hypothetical protein [candidate division KSB1 bacterium]
MLQNTLMRTWNKWVQVDKGLVDTNHYEKIGTLKTALSRHADEALNELSPSE